LSFDDCNKINDHDSYLDASKIPPTSVLVESLFSESGYIFDASRLGTSSTNIEELMFLKKNHFLWDLSLVSELINDDSDDDEGF
jgi:hypothetical protein